MSNELKDKRVTCLELLADFQTMYTYLQCACEDDEEGKPDREFLNTAGLKLYDKYMPLMLSITRDFIADIDKKEKPNGQ